MARNATGQAQIFISYRREEGSGYAGRLYDRLGDHFGRDHVFMDVDTIELGVDFAKRIEDAVGSCDALIAIIGKQWLTVLGKDGRPRLQAPGDFVALEIAAALRRNIRVFPVLVQGATMPDVSDLPPELRPLARMNALEVQDTDWNHDVGRLIEALDSAVPRRQVLRPGGGQPPPPRPWVKKLIIGLVSLAALAFGTAIVVSLLHGLGNGGAGGPGPGGGSIVDTTTISLSPSSGPVGSTITVQGSGFQAGEAIVIDFNADEVGRAVADRSGRFSQNITVPPNSPPGNRFQSHVLARGKTSLRFDSAPFSVN
jgi:hypothetical protein